MAVVVAVAGARSLVVYMLKVVVLEQQNQEIMVKATDQALKLAARSLVKVVEVVNKAMGSSSSSGSINNDSPQVHKSHPLAYHTSRILDDEIAKSKSLKSIDSLLGGLDINDF